MIEDHRLAYDTLTDPPVDADTFATLMCDVEDAWEAFGAARSVRDDALYTRDALIMVAVRELGRNRVAALASLSRERVGQIVAARRNQWIPESAETDIDVLQRALTRRTSVLAGAHSEYEQARTDLIRAVSACSSAAVSLPTVSAATRIAQTELDHWYRRIK